MKKLTTLAIAIGMMMLAAPAQAHHGTNVDQMLERYQQHHAFLQVQMTTRNREEIQSIDEAFSQTVEALQSMRALLGAYQGYAIRVEHAHRNAQATSTLIVRLIRGQAVSTQGQRLSLPHFRYDGVVLSQDDANDAIDDAIDGIRTVESRVQYDLDEAREDFVDSAPVVVTLTLLRNKVRAMRILAARIKLVMNARIERAEAALGNVVEDVEETKERIEAALRRLSRALREVNEALNELEAN